jgi:hypothetical protein
MLGVPHEVSITGVYFPPMLLAAFLGVVATWLTVVMLNRYRLSRFFVYPPMIFVALTIIYTSLVGALWIPF